jgi:hypothetical protein
VRLVIARGVGQVRDVLGAGAPDEFHSVREAVDAVRADRQNSRAGPAGREPDGKAESKADSEGNLMGGST